MKFSRLFSLLFIPAAMACNHESIARQAQGDEPLLFSYTQGNDPPADPATASYFINHMGMMASDLNRTREWYSTVLGMRHVFTMELSPDYALMYMAHSQGGRNGTGYQTGVEMARDKNNMAGLIEFQWYSGSKDRVYKALNPRVTFSHFGLIVDDVEATQTRFDSLGVRIIKRYDELNLSGDTQEGRLLGGAWGFSNVDSQKGKEDIEKVKPALEKTGFERFLVVADPDGNMFEVQALVPSLI